MRVLLDEQLPRQLARYLVGHDVRTVQQQSWAGFTNGIVLDEAEKAGFLVFLTDDRNLEHQQSIAHRKVGVVALSASQQHAGRSAATDS